ncbi:hypothetical protein KK141_09235 [Dyella sp. LX-66]|uniref:hypothetical protein n=1 Tax=unclassified Dyella TaxID=2634549 RepID=UPI001BDFC5CD|nr:MULTISPECIES: hypothetical protein [unclassified Dyella]MBT2117208.1 hypothetical protein [Dyella sp. LX-1]MBT2139716.1 hypothetical protein [Dyella sp. LX-66]
MTSAAQLFQRRVLMGALLLLVFLLGATRARADDASCYAAMMQAVARNEANIQAGWPYYHRDNVSGQCDSGGGCTAYLDYHYGNTAPGIAGRDTPQFACAAGEQPNPPDPCKTAAPRYGYVEYDGTATAQACDGQCAYALIEGDGSSNGQGQSVMSGKWKPTGAHCSGTSPGFGDGAPEPPNLCGTASCMKPGSGDVCAKDRAGNGMCVPGPVATGPGGCTGTADGAICAGPKPPLPTPPQLTQITDPATEVTGNDHYTQQTTSTGGGLPIVTPINVVTYGVGGAQDSPTSSGQQAGDKGPAPASSAGNKPSNTASGGGDCGSPPAMTGDAALAMIARQEWLARCGPDKADKNGNGQPDWTEVTDADSERYGTTDTNPSSVFQDKDVTLDKVDQTSWAGNSCPDIGTAEVFGQQWTAADPMLFCAWLAKVRAVILVFGAIAAATILALGSR